MLNDQFMTESKTDRLVDAATRAACTESERSPPRGISSSQSVGTLVGHANRPLTAEFCERAMIKNTVSLSWRIGRAVMLANKQGRIGQVGQIIIDALGGPGTGKVLFAGKITEVSRRVYKGHTVGEISISAIAQDEMDDANTVVYSGIMRSMPLSDGPMSAADSQSRSKMRTSMRSWSETGRKTF